MDSYPPAKKQKVFQNKYKNYYKPGRKQFLEIGQRGFLATCNFREKECIRECYNILNEYADNLYGVQAKSETVPDSNESLVKGTGDISDNLDKDIAAAGVTKLDKNTVKHRFQAVDTGSVNCIFIRTTLPDPVELGLSIVKDIERTRKQKSRFLLRLVPIEVVCRANLTDLITAAGTLFDKYFLKKSYSFSIIFNKRYNNDIKRDDVIRELADLVHVKNTANRVDLKMAEKTIIVEVIKGMCCLAVVDTYLRFKKYNILELANAKEDKEIEPNKIEKEMATAEKDISNDFCNELADDNNTKSI